MYVSREAGMLEKRIIGRGVLVVAAVYFLGFPIFWSQLPMTASAKIPETWPHDQDLPIDIAVHAWHGCFQVVQVRLYPDPERTRLADVERIFDPVLLLDETERPAFNRFTLNRFTYPRTRTLRVVAPLERLTQEGGLRSGTLEGTLDVQIAYRSGGTRRTRTSNMQPSITMQKIPFRVTLE